MKTLYYALLISVSAIASTALADKVYTWTDNNGVVHYSEKPPASGNARVLNIRTRATEEPSTGEAENGADRQAAADRENVKVPTEEPLTLTLAEKRENCDRARQNLSTLETRPRVLTTDPATGEQRVLTHDEHAEMIIKSREDVRKYCNG